MRFLDNTERDLFWLLVLLILGAYFVGYAKLGSVLGATIVNVGNTFSGRDSSGKFAAYPAVPANSSGGVGAMGDAGVDTGAQADMGGAIGAAIGAAGHAVSHALTARRSLRPVYGVGGAGDAGDSGAAQLDVSGDLSGPFGDGGFDAGGYGVGGAPVVHHARARATSLSLLRFSGAA